MNTQTMPNEVPNEVRMPLVQTGSIGVGVCVVAALLGGFVALERGGLMSDGLWTLLATIPGVLIPAVILLGMPPKPAMAWSVPVLAGTMIRALTVLTIGISVFMIAAPDRVVFFLTMLSVLMITLIVDVAAVLSLIQKHTPGMTPSADAEGIA